MTAGCHRALMRTVVRMNDLLYRMNEDFRNAGPA